MTSISLRRAVARALTLVTVPAAVVLTTATTANAAALPILHSTGDTAHVCIVLGDDGTTRGVACIDLGDTVTVGAPDYGSFAEAEMFCQRLSDLAYVQCADATADIGFASGNGKGDSLNPIHMCGHNTKACSSNTRNYGVVIGQGLVFPNSETSCTTLGTDHEEWAYLGGGGNTKIELPVSGLIVSLNSNFETGHYFICP